MQPKTRVTVPLGCALIFLLYIALVIVGWGLSIIKFAKSDFESPYRREAVYGVGVFLPPTAAIIGYLTIEDGKANESKN